MSSTSSATFTGQSSYASSLQGALTRAVSIASLPMQTIEASVTTLQSQQTALNSLESTFNTLQTAITNLNSVAKGTASASTTSTAITTAAASGATPGTYTIQVDAVGTPTTAMSDVGTTTITDPSSQSLSSSSSYTLTVDSNTYTIKPSSTSSLTDLAAAINDSGAGVTATVVNVGGTDGSSYRLSITGSIMGSQNIQLNDGTTDLISNLSPGSAAKYELNGSTTQTTGTSNTVTLSPGVTVNLLDTTDSAVTVTVSNSYSSVSSALSTLVTSYNAAVTALAAHRGSSGGALSGQSIIFSMDQVLSRISQYTGSGSVSSLAALGVTVDSTGYLSLNTTTFNSLSTSEVQSFLGSVGTSGGFLYSANTALSSVTDSTSGMIHQEYTSLQDEVTRDDARITAEQARIATLQTSLVKTLSAADAAISTLEAQKSYFTQLFQAVYGTNSSNG